MSKELFSIAERIRALREKSGMTQAELARLLGLSRSGINAWEMGLPIPSTPYIVELSKSFNVSSDYLLGIENTSSISVKGLNEREVSIIADLGSCLSKK